MYMDKYLEKGISLQRLIDEYNKYGSLYIGFDFDDTIYDFHQKGTTYYNVIQLLKDLKEIGCILICWTGQSNHKLVEDYLKEIGIEYDGINCNGITLGWDTRKPMFSALLDDRAGLIQVYNELTELVKIIKSKNNV